MRYFERLFLVGVFLLLGRNSFCQLLSREQLTGKWIGVHTEFDSDFFCPLPTFLDLQADGTYYLGMVDGSASPKKLSWDVISGTLKLDTLTLNADLVTLTNNVLRIGQLYPMVFRRFEEVAIDSLVAFRMLNGQVWETDSLRLSLFSNGKVFWENRHSGEKTVHCWRLAKHGKALFLITQGNSYTCDGNYKPLWQITSLANHQFKAVGSHGRTVTTESFRFVRTISPKEVPQSPDFQPCDNCFGHIWSTFADQVPWRNRGKLYEIRKAFDHYYIPVQAKGQSGLVQVRFVVNCEGAVGMLEAKGMDEDYCAKQFDTQITEQLTTICRTKLGHDWGDNKAQETKYDISVLLNFRFKNGLITDIYL